MVETRLPIAAVDDNETERTALRRPVRSADFDMETFASGAEFLESLKAHRPDCVVLDLHMPQVNGFSVPARLAEAGIRLPVVVIIGHDAPETRERVLAGRASAHLCKPVDDQVLLDAIHLAIREGHGP